MAKTPNRRTVKTETNTAAILLPKEPLWYPPDYRHVRAFLVTAASAVERARSVRNCRHLPAGLECLDRLSYAILTLQTEIETTIEAVRAAAPQQYLRFTDDHV